MITTGLNIGLNGSMLDDHPTGVGVYSANVINHLTVLYQNEIDKKITVFTPTSMFLNKQVRTIKLCSLLKSSQYGKLGAVSRFLWNTFFYPLQARNFDILLSTTTHGSFSLNNQIITIHDLLSLRFNNISWHQRFYYTHMLPLIVSKAKLIIAISETTKQDIVHFLKCPEEKIKVVYNGYDENIFNGEPIFEKLIFKRYNVQNYFLAVGPTYPHKNFKLLIDAYSGLDEEIKRQYPLVIAGGLRKYTDHLKSYVKELKLNKYILFTGYVPMTLMSNLYKEAYALVFPSLYEGFGFPVLEAMACGCPVIASNASSIPEVSGMAALYFDPYNKEELSNQLKKIVSDRILYEELKAKGLQQAIKFSWSKTAKQLKDIIENNLHKSVEI